MTENKTFNEIKEKLEKASLNLAQKYGLDFLIIFGSYAKGKARENSDIDIGIKGKLDFKDELELACEIHEIIGNSNVDLVNLGKGSPLITYQACRGAVVIFEREAGIFANFRAESFVKFVETKPLRDINFARTLNYVKNYSTISL